MYMDRPRFVPDRQPIIAANLAEYGEDAASIAWITPAAAAAAEKAREKRLNAIGADLRLSFRATKPHIGLLSPGCHICGQGDWSCLFINGQCNCRCFYCPTPQNDSSPPTTNRLPFTEPADYAAYIAHFGFQGMSISGGEPLMTPDLSLRYLRTVDRSPARPRHLWMYTNGTLLTADLVSRLVDAGLNELRFDLSAVEYSLKSIRLAVGRVPVVTVEIPAIPEDVHRLEALLPILAEMGVNHLNLHQLRLTPHNRPQLTKHRYTYLHGERVTVLESELAAIAILQHVAEQGIGLAVNYCSFVFKHRFQRAAARRHSARFTVKPHESITENGYIRALGLIGDPPALARQVQLLERQGVDRRLWSLDSRGGRLDVHPDLWDRLAPGVLQLSVSYAESLLCPHLSYRRAFTAVRLGRRKEIFIEKQPVTGRMVLEGASRRRFETLVLRPTDAAPPLPVTAADEFLAFEFIPSGLQDYF